MSNSQHWQACKWVLSPFFAVLRILVSKTRIFLQTQNKTSVKFHGSVLNLQISPEKTFNKPKVVYLCFVDFNNFQGGERDCTRARISGFYPSAWPLSIHFVLRLYSLNLKFSKLQYSKNWCHSKFLKEGHRQSLELIVSNDLWRKTEFCRSFTCSGSSVAQRNLLVSCLSYDLQSLNWNSLISLKDYDSSQFHQGFVLLPNTMNIKTISQENDTQHDFLMCSIHAGISWFCFKIYQIKLQLYMDSRKRYTKRWQTEHVVRISICPFREFALKNIKGTKPFLTPSSRSMKSTLRWCWGDNKKTGNQNLCHDTWSGVGITTIWDWKFLVSHLILYEVVSSEKSLSECASAYDSSFILIRKPFKPLTWPLY